MNSVDTTLNKGDIPCHEYACTMSIVAIPLVSGLRAIRLAQTAFLSQVFGLRCFVYQKVKIRPIVTHARAGAPGTKVTHIRDRAYSPVRKLLTVGSVVRLLGRGL